MRTAVWLMLMGLAGCTDHASLPTGPTSSGATAGAPPLEIPSGYTAHPVAKGLADPRAVLFDPGTGQPLVVEGERARLSRVQPDGSLAPVAQGGGNGPWTGAAVLNGRIYVAEAGGLRGRILRIDPGGQPIPVKAKLPGGGTVGPLAAGPDGWLYVGVASAAAGTGQSKDIPCQDVRIRGGGRMEGAVPCTGSVLRLRPEDGRVELYAWGFHDPAGLAFAADGRLLVSEHLPPPQQAAAGDVIWHAVPGVWYGWPDFAGQLALADPQLADIPNPPPPPLTRLKGNAGAIATAREPAFGGTNQAFVALAAPPGGESEIAFTSLDSGATAAFAANLQSPTAVAFAPDGASLWVAEAGTGALWRITPAIVP